LFVHVEVADVLLPQSAWALGAFAVVKPEQSLTT